MDQVNSQSESRIRNTGLDQILDDLLNPKEKISDPETISWLNYLIAEGRDPADFVQLVKSFDNAVSCGLVWTANFVAYRCRTCGISPCMSLCAECFQKGSHVGHDYNMFRSQAGGACDCGDPSVMKESGFCSSHQPGANDRKPKAPNDLLIVGKSILPRLLHRLLLQLRKNTPEALKEADDFLTSVLTAMTEMGAAMRSVMTGPLIEPAIYAGLASSESAASFPCMRCFFRLTFGDFSVPECDSNDPSVAELMRERLQSYERAKEELTSFTPRENFHKECTVCSDAGTAIKAFERDLVHTSFAEELLFWTIVYKFPQTLVCFLLNMLPDNQYKAHFAEAFVHHYSRVSIMQARFRHDEEEAGPPSQSRPSQHDLLSNCVVHVSVQLFSNEPLAARLCREHHLLHVMIASLRATIEGAPSGSKDVEGILTRSTLQNMTHNRHNVVRCDHYIMRKHAYWPLASDLNNILTHYPVAMIFMNDSCLLQSWLQFILNFQSMNLNTREMDEHVEYENESYYAAFSAELEICATPIWTLISHLKDDTTAELTKNIVRVAASAIDEWHRLIPFSHSDAPHAYQATFHIPLHRYYSIFMQHAASNQSVPLAQLLPSSEAKLKLYLAHPLQVMISFYEILCGLWVRNGLQMKGQAMTYIQCHFCNSMIDPDLFLIQQCASQLEADWFVRSVLQRFHVWEWLSFSFTRDKPFRRGFLESDQVMPMLEGALTFLATLFSVRTNLGMTETDITRQEMVTLLSISDRTYSQLSDMLPEKCGTTGQNKDFEKLLQEIADFKEPGYEMCGNLSQGMYFPKPEIWEKEYDPLHVLLRAVHRRDYQSSMDRFGTFIKQSGKSSTAPWPPFRLPSAPDTSKFLDPRQLLYSKVLHSFLFTILYKALYVADVTDQVLALTVYLIEMALNYPSPKSSSPCPVLEPQSSAFCVADLNFSEWYSSDWILSNFNTIIRNVSSPQAYAESSSSLATRSSHSDDPSVEEMEVVFDSSDEDYSDHEWETAPSDGEQMDIDSIEPIEGPPITHSLPGVEIPLALPSSAHHSHAPEQPSSSTALVALNPPTPATPPAQQSLGPPAIPGPSTSPSNAVLLAAMRPIQRPHRRRFMRRPHKLSFLEEAARSAPAGFSPELNDPEMAELMRALPFSSSSTSLSHSSVQVDESILSLLLKLHSKLSNEPDSYRPGPVPDSRIGDGPFFIRSVLNTYVKLNPYGEKAVDEWRRKIWPRVEENSNSAEKSDREREADMGNNRRNELEERRRKAKERQQKLMAEFASRQKAFMKKMEMDNKMNKDLDGDEANEGPEADQTDGQAPGASVLRQQEYECVICSQTTPSTNDKLIGMVALLQSTSVLAHSIACSNIEDHSDSVLPCDPEQIAEQKERSTLASYMDFKVDEFTKNFNPVSWQKSLSIGWEGGVHVQSCGHYLHLDCHKSYVQSLRNQSQSSRSGLEQGDFACPLCRQMANSVLPVIPETQGAISPSWTSDRSMICTDVLALLTNLDTPEKSLIKLLGSFMEDLTRATLPQYRSMQPSPTTQSLFLFLCSIVRTNLECDVLVRLSRSAPVGAKKASFGSLFKVLALNAKVFIQEPYNNLWTQLTGLPDLQDLGMGLVQSRDSHEKEVPLLLRDPIALMIQVLFALPVNIDRAFFTTVIQALFNLNVTQSLAQLTCLIDNEMRSILKTIHQTQLLSSGSETFAVGIQSFMGLLIETLEQGSIYQHLCDDSASRKSWDVNRLIAASRNICLPFLRSAAVLQNHLYGIEYSCGPAAEGSDEELIDLIKLLSLNLVQSNKSDFTSSVFWPITSPSLVIELWCQEFNGLAQLLPITAEVRFFKLLVHPVLTCSSSIFRNYCAIGRSACKGRDFSACQRLTTSCSCSITSEFAITAKSIRKSHASVSSAAP